MCITRQTYHTHINNTAFLEIIAQRKFVQDLYFTFLIDLKLNKDGLINYLIKAIFSLKNSLIFTSCKI